MRKTIVAALTIAACLGLAMPAHAQVLKLGVTGGVSRSELKISHSDVRSKEKTGFFVGPTLKIALPLLPLGFDVAALYDQREFDLGDEGMPVKLKQLDIPVNVRLTSSPAHSSASTSTTRKRCATTTTRGATRTPTSASISAEASSSPISCSSVPTTTSTAGKPAN